MRQIILSIASIALFLSACSKGDSNDIPGENQFVVGSTTYDANVVVGVNSSITASASSTSGSSTVISLTFGGATLPTTGGLFRVVSPASSPTSTQVAVTVTNPGGDGWKSTGDDNLYARVTMSGSKINVALPKVKARSTVSAEITDVSANLTQD